MTKDIRPAIRKLTLGPLASSIAFWVSTAFVILAAWSLFNVWHLMRSLGSSSSMEPLLLLAACILMTGTYIFFSELFRMRKAAQAETDNEKVGLICAGIDLAVRMFYFGAGGLALGFGMCFVVLHR